MDYSFIEDPELKALLEKKDKDQSSRPSKRKKSKKLNNEGIKVSNQKNLRKNKGNFRNQRTNKIKKPSTKNLALATKQLASMLKSGLPLLEGLEILYQTTEDKTLRIVFKEASISLSKGSTFVSILQKYPEVFDDMYIALVSAGELAGLLEEVLDREALLLESLSKVKSQIKSAVTYPIAIFILTFIVVAIMMLFVIPVFENMYASSGTELPRLTQFMINASDFVRDPLQILKTLPILIIIFIYGKKLFKKESFLLYRDSILLKLPLVGDLVTKSSLANFSRTLAALNSAGIPILESLLISKKTLGNRVFKNIIEKMNVEIQSGQPIYKVLSTQKVIPQMFSAMFRIGEETGELSEMVNKLADFYEDEVESSVKSLTSLIEPFMIVFVAIVVAFILIAMYLPMFNMINTIG